MARLTMPSLLLSALVLSTFHALAGEEKAARGSGARTSAAAGRSCGGRGFRRPRRPGATRRVG